ncbi:MAG: outer membrane protein transport protein [Aquirhabdus sp.]
MSFLSLQRPETKQHGHLITQVSREDRHDVCCDHTPKRIGSQSLSMKLMPVLMGLCLSSVAHAELAQNLSVDIRSLSLGNAVTADPPGISAIHFNPAGLSHIQGLQTDLQGIMLGLHIDREISAPPGFNVFGYSDDPVVCNMPSSSINGNGLCPDFKVAKSKVKSVSLYVPILDKIVNMPKGLPVAIPFGAVAYRAPDSKITYADGFYAPLAVGFNQEKGDPGNFMGEMVSLERITYLSPSASYQVSDNLSLGASIGISYASVALNTDLRLPNELIGVLRLVDENICAPFKQNSSIITDLLLFGVCNAQESVGPFKKIGSLKVSMDQTASPSYNLGLLWEPSDDFALGMVYQSSAKQHLKGHYKLKVDPGAPDLVAALQSSVTGQILSALLGFPNSIPTTSEGLASMNLEYPAHFQTGIKYKIFPDLQVNFDVGWTDYSVWKELPIQFDRNLGVLQIAKLLAPTVTANSLAVPLNFVSPWNFGVGIEYSMTNRLKLRLGYEPRTSAIPSGQRSTLVPVNGAQLFGMGAGYRFDKDTDIDLTAAFLRSRDSIPANTSKLANYTGVDNLILNPYAGLDVKTNATIVILGIAYRTRW